ncbi:MAG: hypothetical protein HN341_10710 [Verrucomicrobia bacterium]|jgi:hypothetical protein|nr:hypothetical protein [Verrucomicrobiota bacterium]
MKTFAMLLFSMTMLLPLIGLVGCETESSDQASVTITPNTATLAVGASQTFVATGWDGYTWALDDSSAGTLSTTTGDTTIYTAVTELGDTPQELKVSATSSSTSTTNGTTTTTATGTALITQPTSSTASSSSVAIAPLTVTVQSGGNTSFTAYGGDGAYSWSLSEGTAGSGTLAYSGSTATYTANTYTNAPDPSTVSVTSDGSSAAATITHQ